MLEEELVGFLKLVLLGYVTIRLLIEFVAIWEPFDPLEDGYGTDRAG